MKESEYCQVIDDLLKLNNIYLDDEVFEKVCDVVIEFIILLNQL